MGIKFRDLKDYRLEADVKRDIKKILDHFRWWWWMPPSNAFGKSGIADFNALRDGTFLVIEAKHNGETPTANQINYLRGVAANGGIAFVVDRNKLELLYKYMETFDRVAQAHVNKTPVSRDDVNSLVGMDAILTGPYK